jgi:hypothetical protein
MQFDKPSIGFPTFINFVARRNQSLLSLLPAMSKMQLRHLISVLRA